MASRLVATAHGRIVDGAGVVLLALSVGWTCWTARGGRGDALPAAALQLGCAGSYVVARALTGWQRPLVPVAVVAGVASVLVLQSTLPNVAPLSAPLGYANANAALYVLVALSAGMVAASLPPGPATAAALPLAGAFAIGAVASGSVTGAIVLVLVVVLVGSRALGSWRGVVWTCAIAVQLVIAITALLAVMRVDGRRVSVAERLVHERRVSLWRDAAVIAGQHPLDGAGPCRFKEMSATARSDADARWAHSGFLQQAAEQGAIGLSLLLAALGWGFLRLWTARSDDTFSVLGALTIAALALHASVDYVLHFAAVPLVAAALVGAASACHPAPEAGNPG